MKISEFAQIFPDLAIDFDRQLRDQPRVYDGPLLDQFPVELEPEHAYLSGSRGRPNPNQTLAHSQCATCHRVLRNDFFYTVPSMMKRNVVFPHCRACNQQHNAERYEGRADIIRARREALWRYLAPECAVCGFDKHMSALEIHHTAAKEKLVQELMTRIALSIDAGLVETLLHEAAEFTVLCSNCHRMYHAGALKLSNRRMRNAHRIADLLTILKSAK